MEAYTTACAPICTCVQSLSVHYMCLLSENVKLGPTIARHSDSQHLKVNQNNNRLAVLQLQLCLQSLFPPPVMLADVTV